jgi:hypothetical protein
VTPRINISAGELFELIRPAALILSALISTWVFASARRRFPLYVALLWAGRDSFVSCQLFYRSTSSQAMIWHRSDSRLTFVGRIIMPLIYAAAVLGGTLFYLRQERPWCRCSPGSGRLREGARNHREAIAQYQAALVESDDPHIHKLLGIELSAMNYWTDALGEFRLAQRGGEPDDLIIVHVAGLLNVLNQPNQARLEYERFLTSSLCTQQLPDERCEKVRKVIESPVK